MTKTKWYAKPIYVLFALALVLSLGLVALPMAGTVEASPGTTNYVATTGSDTTGDGSEGNPWATITYSLTQVIAGDTIIVAPGTYVEYTGPVSAGCALNIPWFAEGAGGLTVKSSHGAASTIIDCGWAGWGVQIVSNEITFSGFTVKNAYSVINQVSAKGHKLSNLIITDFVNYGLGVAHGVECEFSNLIIHTNDVSKSTDRTVKGIDFIGYGSGGNNDCRFEDITIYDIVTTGTYGTSFGIYWSTSSTFPDWDNTFTDVTIHDLSAENWMACGIYIKGRAPGTTPYAIENTIFSGGNIYNMGGDAAATRGFYMDGGCKNLSISGFNIGCDKGIYFSHHGQEACVNVDIHYNNIVGTTEYGVQDYNGDNDVNATNNWWGDASGPYHPTSWTYDTTTVGPNPGLGDQVSDYVLYEPWLKGPFPSVEAAFSILEDLGVEIDELLATDFNNAKQQKALLNKVDAVFKQIEAGAYQGAINKLQNDVTDKIEKWVVEAYWSELTGKVEAVIAILEDLLE